MDRKATLSWPANLCAKLFTKPGLAFPSKFPGLEMGTWIPGVLFYVEVSSKKMAVLEVGSDLFWQCICQTFICCHASSALAEGIGKAVKIKVEPVFLFIAKGDKSVLLGNGSSTRDCFLFLLM